MRGKISKAEHMLRLMEKKIPFSRVHVSKQGAPALIIEHNDKCIRIIYFKKKSSFRAYEGQQSKDLKLFSNVLDYLSDEFGWQWENRGLRDGTRPGGMAFIIGNNK